MLNMLTARQKSIIRLAACRVAETNVGEFYAYIIDATRGWKLSNREFHAVINEALRLYTTRQTIEREQTGEQQLDV